MSESPTRGIKSVAIPIIVAFFVLFAIAFVPELVKYEQDKAAEKKRIHSILDPLVGKQVDESKLSELSGGKHYKAGESLVNDLKCQWREGYRAWRYPSLETYNVLLIVDEKGRLVEYRIFVS